MKKRLLCIPLLGVLAMSLSSCRSEDTIVQQTQNNEASKQFSVFTPKKTGEIIDYAKGFAYLMQRYDKLKKTNLSGMNNKHIIGNLNASTEKNTSVFQNSESYVEFNIPSETIIQENGDKWVVFPKVKDNKVIGLIASILTHNGTYVKYNVYGEQNEWYKQNASLFQDALDNYKLQLKRLNLSASINPVADYNIPGVTVPGKPKLPQQPDRPGWRPDQEPDGGGCSTYEDCSAPDFDPGGGSSAPAMSDSDRKELEALENDYKKDMSEAEKKIYDGLTVFQKLDYLRSGYRARNAAMDRYPLREIQNGKGDAFRHALFSALTVRTLGVDLSTRLLNAHEENPRQPLLEKQMDLYNNQIGKEIPYSVTDLEGYVQNLVDTGKLMVLYPLNEIGEPVDGITKLIPSNTNR